MSRRIIKNAPSFITDQVITSRGDIVHLMAGELTVRLNVNSVT